MPQGGSLLGRYHCAVVTVTRFMTGFARFVARVFVTVLGAVFALVGLLLVLGVGLFGVAAALVLVAWARLRGRPAPPVRFQWRQAWVRRGRFGARFGGSAGAFGRRQDTDVVDVEFTESRAPDARPPRRLE
jgi:hypothetical protein